MLAHDAEPRAVDACVASCVECRGAIGLELRPGLRLGLGLRLRQIAHRARLARAPRVCRKASSSLNEIHELDRQVKGLRSAIDSPENRDTREVIDARVRAVITMHEDLELLVLRLLKTNPPKPLSPPDRARIVRVVDDPQVLEVVSALTRDDTRAGGTAGFGRLARTGGLLRHRH
jgi:hypothetical protein